ncbi:MAG: hypothetical protein ABJA67_07055 [Chthonomonadales bacterium]
MSRTESTQLTRVESLQMKIVAIRLYVKLRRLKLTLITVIVVTFSIYYRMTNILDFAWFWSMFLGRMGEAYFIFSIIAMISASHLKKRSILEFIPIVFWIALAFAVLSFQPWLLGEVRRPFEDFVWR